MKIKLFLIGLVSLMICSCTTVKHTSSTLDVKTSVVSFAVADVDVSPQKVSKSYEWSFNLFRMPDIATYKMNVTAQLLDEVNADVLVEPQFIIERYGFMRGGRVTVIGFPAKYKNFHKMTEEEALIYKEVIQNAPQKDKCTKRFLFF